MSSAKTIITIRALVQRINRKLADKKQKLVALRGVAVRQFGQYVVVEDTGDVETSGVVHKNVDLVLFGKKLGVIREWESLK